MQQRASGFTLVELSIVLVILGLLVGGVLSGQSLIRAAELRAVTTERDKYATALYAFKDKYLALPGDMPNAFAFWGGQGDGCAVNDIMSDADYTACNGDGNGSIGTGVNDREPHKVFFHLSKAGLVEGTYAGVITSGYIDNVPASKFPTASWVIHGGQDGGVISSTGNEFGGTYLSFSGYLENSPAYATGLKHEEAWNIDKKADDGRALTGSVRGMSACRDIDFDGDASNGNEDVYAIQNANNSGHFCGLSFILQK